MALAKMAVWPIMTPVTSATTAQTLKFHGAFPVNALKYQPANSPGTSGAARPWVARLSLSSYQRLLLFAHIFIFQPHPQQRREMGIWLALQRRLAALDQSLSSPVEPR